MIKITTLQFKGKQGHLFDLILDAFFSLKTEQIGYDSEPGTVKNE